MLEPGSRHWQLIYYSYYQIISLVIRREVVDLDDVHEVIGDDVTSRRGPGFDGLTLRVF
jgi:hypothetical protein